MKKVFLILVAVLFVAACVGVTYYLYQKQNQDPVIYKTESAIDTLIIKKTVATGVVEPRKEVLIKSQVSGIVDKVFVKAGQQVKVGDLLAKIRVVPNMVSLSNAESNLKTAKLNEELAKKELDRQQKLFDERIIAETEYLRYKQDFELKQEAVRAAEDNLELIRKGSSRRHTSTSTLVKATVTGMLLDVPVKEGSYVIESNTFNEGTTIASIANMQDMIFKGKVVESEVGKIKVGMPLTLTIGAIETEKFDANLEFISPKGVEDKGAIQFEVKAALNLKDGQFVRAGYSANADIILDKRDKALAIKEKNVKFSGDSTYVFVETQPQVFRKQLIKTGLSDDIYVEVLSGLTKKDKVKIL